MNKYIRIKYKKLHLGRSGYGASRPDSPERGAQSPVRGVPHEYWPSASSLSDNDEVELVLDYNVTINQY